MSSVCHSSLQPIKGAGYTPASRRKLAGGNKQFPHQLSFAKADVISFRTKHIEHMSISGVQDKISLKLDRGGKLRPTEKDGEYILKPIPATPLPAFQKDVPANEHLTMQIAGQLLGITIPPNACVELSDGEPAYLVKRFDRSADGKKIAQEDFCQLSNRSPDSGRNYKYEGSYEELGALLKKYCVAYKTEAEKLFRLICFNYAFSNGDAHLKNFSLIQTVHGDHLLSPAYDLLCTSTHLPNESSMALDLFDDFESDYFQINGFYGRTDFMELARRFELPEQRSAMILNTFAARKDAILNLIDRSFLNPAAKQDYQKRFTDRLHAIRPNTK
jgi:serine/threonine-protein kinase HipA